MLPLWAALVPALAAAADANPADDLRRKLDAAQARGAFFLSESQAMDGSWRANDRGFSNYADDLHVRAAVTAICLNGLRAAGRAHDASAKKAEDYLRGGGLHPRDRGMPPKPEVRVYALAYGLMAISREAATPERDRRMAELVTEVENLANATDSFAYFATATDPGHRTTRPASFQLAIIALALEEAKQRGAKVRPELLDGVLKHLETARAPNGNFAYYGAQPQNQGALGLSDDAGSAARGPACELALAGGGRGNDASLKRSVECQRRNMEKLRGHANRPVGNPIHDAADSGIAPYYYLFSLYWTARAIHRLPEADRRPTAEDILNSLLAQEVKSAEGEPIGIWEDSEEFSGPSYGTGTALDTLGILRPYIRR